MDFKNLTKTQLKRIRRKTIITNREVKEWCKRAYPDHPNGCPNYNNKVKCPPHNRFIGDFIDNYSYFYLIYCIFNFKKYKKIRKKENSQFFKTERRLSCCLYWQDSVRKILYSYIKNILNDNTEKELSVLVSGSGHKEYYSMESVGINVLSTLRLNGISIERNPKDWVILASLICSKNKIRRKRNSSLLNF